MDHTIKVYSTTTCPYCTMLKNYLKSHNIPFQDLDVAHDRNALMEMRQRTGQMGVPVIDIDGKVIIGFDKEEIAKALDIVEKV